MEYPPVRVKEDRRRRTQCAVQGRDVTEMEKACQQKEMGHLHLFVIGICGALNRSEHRFATKAASLIMEWFMRGCAAWRGPDLLL
eukprot:5351947-Prymnesium_polylepis.1